MKLDLSDRAVPGLLLLLAGATFMVGVMLAETMAPDYSMNANAISDLGTIPQSSALFNLTLVLTGLLTAAGGLLFHRHHSRRAVTALFLLAGLGAIGAGVFNLNTPDVHGLFALLAFVAYNILAVVAASLARGPMRALSVLLGAVGLLFVVVMFLGDSGMADLFGPIGHGGAERMIVFPVMIWMLGFGGYMMNRGAEPARS